MFGSLLFGATCFVGSSIVMEMLYMLLKLPKQQHHVIKGIIP